MNKVLFMSSSMFEDSGIPDLGRFDRGSGKVVAPMRAARRSPSGKGSGAGSDECSVGVGRDDLADGAGAEGVIRAGIDRLLDELDGAIGHREVRTAGMETLEPVSAGFVPVAVQRPGEIVELIEVADLAVDVCLAVLEVAPEVQWRYRRGVGGIAIDPRKRAVQVRRILPGQECVARSVSA